MPGLGPDLGVTHSLPLINGSLLALHYTTLHYTTLHYTTRHYTTLHFLVVFETIAQLQTYPLGPLVLARQRDRDALVWTSSHDC